MAVDTNDSEASSPQTPLSVPNSPASRGDRLLASIVDIAITIAIALPVAIWTGEFTALIHAQAVPRSLNLENLLAVWVGFFLVNTYLLIKNGQTVGKRFLSIRISDRRSGAVPPFWRLLVRVAVPSIFGLFGALGGLFSLVDDLFIFSKDRRCIHDWIASTRVVKA